MKIYEFSGTTITPLFMGGYDQEPEIRPASVKGVLRWWFRSLYGGYLYSLSPPNSKKELLKSLHEKENYLFGSTDKEGIFSLRVIASSAIQTKVNGIAGTSGQSPYSFYGAYGLAPTRQGKGRSYIPHDQKFTLKFVFRKEDGMGFILAALSALNLFGGMGSRSTRGFGSVNFRSLNSDQLTDILFPDFGGLNEVTFARSMKDIYSKISEIYGINSRSGSLQLPEFSIINPEFFSFLIAKGSYSNHKEALAHFSKKLREFRENKNEQGSRPEIFHSYDYQAVFGKQEIPHYTIFGLPHNFQTGKSKIRVELKGSNENRHRRVSPLRLKVQKVGKVYVNILVLFRAKFLPSNDKILAMNKELEIPGYERAIEFQKKYCRG